MKHAFARPLRFWSTALAGAALLAACNTAAPDVDGNAPGYGPRDNYTTYWTLQQAITQKRSPETTIPAITDWPRGEAKTLPGHHVWDSWPIRRLDNRVATVEGYSLMIHLSVPDNVLPGKRHDIAQLRWSYSRDGKDWALGGLLFPGNHGGVVEGVVLGSRNWAGSAVITEDNKVYAFYTATGEKGENVLPTRALSQQRGGVGARPLSDTYDGYPRTPGISYEQRIAVAWGPTLVVRGGAPRFEGEWQHKVILEADGRLYQTQAQADVGPLNAFRDPWVFRDPRDGNIYMLLEGNVGGANKSAQTCPDEAIGDAQFRGTVSLPAEAPWFNGNIGLAAAVNNDLTSWELLPPILQAPCVNQELERPHFVFRDGKYYLFTASHVGKFAPIRGLVGFEALYGFVGDSIRGPFKPLNGSGLVMANPAGQPFQAYSWDVLDAAPELLVTSFVDYPGTQDINAVGGLTPEEQLAGFGGTLAPTIQIQVQGDTARIVNTWDNGRVRKMGEPAQR